MNLKIKAALIVAGIVCMGVLGSIVAQFLPWYVLPGILLLVLTYFMYQIVLTQLNLEARIEEMRKK